MSKKLNQLINQKVKAEKQLLAAQYKEKYLEHEVKSLTRRERTHRLCVRGGMLEKFLREPSWLRDEDVLELLAFVFQTETAQKKLNSLIEKRQTEFSETPTKIPCDEQGRNYTPVARCVAFCEAPCREQMTVANNLLCSSRGSVASPALADASYPL
ncbi:DUF3847 domain-containing protein [Faecalibacterium sp. An122]|uniref:DUF3847 domain-containing protein n=1 Tax=Faecalibacterium sp. An122 TaxID=1965551 RepID=UPI000B3ABA5B|nr:DUF3847 domain-containing protein [Faecalibacterium sp. An122]OUQ35308.1 hypothetical protein B5E67_12095 [Faecalibacterium sp. An122]